MGAVWHAINPRLIPSQIIYIANHAEDKVLFFESSFLPLVEKLAPDLPTVRLFVMMVDRDSMPATTAIPDLQCYEDFIATGDKDYVWPEFDELSASSLFYTSGTTGNPKGVLYSHRSDVLHCLTESGARQFWLYSSGHRAADDTDVPCEWCVGIYLYAADGGRKAGFARAEARCCKHR
jgi:fatty-acyl-CoA synthase